MAQDNKRTNNELLNDAYDSENNAIKVSFDGDLELNTLKVGDVDSGDFQNIEADGTQQSIGDATVWDDLVGSLVARRLDSTLGKLNYNYDNNTITMQSGGNPAITADRLIFNFQYPHRALQSIDGTTLAYQHMHIHWEQTSTDQIEWQLDYRVQRNGEAKVTAWTSATSNSTNDSIFTYTSGTINQITNLAIVAVEHPSLSATIQYRLTRTDTTGSDIEAIFVDAHVLIDMDGSRTQWTK